ncbi:hypothetical protein MTP99_014100 [Tenebrio molitor]|nr:hypothetical protein MTP99_014100 [Tenebrio molitor]
MDVCVCLVGADGRVVEGRATLSRHHREVSRVQIPGRMGLPWMFVLYFMLCCPERKKKEKRRGWVWVAGESTPEPHRTQKEKRGKKPTARYLIDQYAKKKNRKKKSPKSNSDSEYDGKSDSDSSRTKKKQKRDSVSSDSESEKKEDIKNNSEPEEGEVSDSSISDEEYNDGYDDQLMGDEEDRARLASLTEKERETEIFKRIEQRELMKTRFEIEKKLRQAKKAERAREKPHRHKDKEKEKDRDHSKLQTDFTSIDHKERSKERKKNIEENRGRVDKRVNAMAELKARREDKQKREEAEEKRKEEQRKKEEEDATHSTNKSAVKLKASDIYSDDSESEECLQEVKAHLTNQDNQGGLLDLALHLVPVQGLRVRHGNQERVFRLEFVSNQEFTDNEYHKWIEASTAAGNALPTKEHVEQKQADIKEALNYEFNEQDIERIIREKERFKPNPHNYAMRKTQLMKERDSALARGDEELTRELGQKLSDLEERASELDKLRTSTISSISYINDRNRKRNVEEAEKAIMAEIKANKGKKIDDPFTRRSTKPRMNFKAAPEEKMEMVVETKPEKVTIEVENPKVPAQPAQVTQDDLFSAHDFDIKIDLDVPLPVASVNVTPKTVTKDLAPRRSLNLQDYKKKRGLI